MYGSSSLIYIRTIDCHDNEETDRQTDRQRERKKGRKKESIFDFVLYEIVLLCTNTMRQQFGYSHACLLNSSPMLNFIEKELLICRVIYNVLLIDYLHTYLIVFKYLLHLFKCLLNIFTVSLLVDPIS